MAMTTADGGSDITSEGLEYLLEITPQDVAALERENKYLRQRIADLEEDVKYYRQFRPYRPGFIDYD